MVERIVVLCRSSQVTLADLPSPLRSGDGVKPEMKMPVASEGMSLEAIERELIVQSLRKFNWNQSKTARHLAISRKALMYRIAKHGIEKGDAERSKRGTVPR
jgi:DNA-binding NtrC family response regulator